MKPRKKTIRKLPKPKRRREAEFDDQETIIGPGNTEGDKK